MMARRRARGGMAFGLGVLATLVGGGCSGDGAVGADSLTTSVPIAESVEARRAVEGFRARLRATEHATPRDLAAAATRYERDGDRVRAVIAGDARRSVPRAASVELPARASGAVRLADDTSSVAISFALEGAAAAPITVADGVARYAGALDGADVLHRVHAEGTEDFVVFEARPAREELRYTVDVTRVAGLRLVSNTLELLDEAGSPRLRVAPPYVVTASGEQRAAELSVEGCAYSTDPRAPRDRPVTRPGAASCLVRVAWSGVTYPAIVDPAWIATGSPVIARYGHTATLLGSGQVLIAGGHGVSGFLSSAELYDPAGAGTFAATGSMATARSNHTATRIASGKVLITGGASGNLPVASALLYDPVAGTFAATGAMTTPRQAHTATLLSSGKVLINGGTDDGGGSSLSSAELYNPAGAGTFAATGAMTAARQYSTATLLASGKVLVAGGGLFDESTAEIFDPAGAGSFAPTGSMGMARNRHTATRIASGKVLIAGGYHFNALPSAELFDPAGRGSFAPTGSMGAARESHTATLLPSGKVLIVAGSALSTLASAELYDPVGAGAFAPTASLATARYLHRATLLPSGQVVVVGGYDFSTTLHIGTAERFNLAASGAACAAPDDCVSGVCNDGVCCSGACSGVCTTCSAGTGACVVVINADDADTCQGALACDGAGACKSKNGQASADPSACLSGFVADGVCCDGACGGACEVCTTALGAAIEGTCGPATTGYAGSPACGKGLSCNGASVSCPVTCASDLDCLAESYCAADGTCHPRKAQASSCNIAANGDCKSAGCRACATGYCVDGVCCDTACDTLCQACAAGLKQAGGADGVCGDAKDETNPHLDACPTSAPSSCGPDGQCDGTGSCRLHAPPGTLCGPAASCQNDAQTTAAICNDSGACTPATTSPCDAYACGATACNVTCSADADCAAGNTCDAATHACLASVATCDGAHITTDADGATHDCTPYTCESNGKCKTKCSSVDECVSPNICEASGNCAPLAGGQSDSESGCAVRPAGGAEGSAGVMLMVMGLVASARRRRVR